MQPSPFAPIASLRRSQSDEAIQRAALPPEPEPEPHAGSSCLRGIGLISGFGGRVATLVAWFPADGGGASAAQAKPRAVSETLTTASTAENPAEEEWFELPRKELASLLAPPAELCDVDFVRPTILAPLPNDLPQPELTVGSAEAWLFP